VKRFFAKPDTWFDEGTEAELVADCGAFGIFLGQHLGKPDEESCGWHEFDVVEEP